MLPIFPLFKKLELGDRSFIEVITKKHPPYSDFNFTSLYIWNTEGNTEISILNDFLIVKMNDYVSDKIIFSFIGEDFYKDRLDALFQYVHKINGSIKLLPESMFKVPKHFEFITEDPDQHDYVYSIQEVIGMNGSKFKKKRNMCKRFAKECTFELREINIHNIERQREVRQLFSKWQTSRNKQEADVENEFLALINLFTITSTIEFITLGIYIDGTLEAVTISEMLHNKCSIIHFQKYNAQYLGIAEYVFIETLKKHAYLGAEILNYEQDLGMQGLRKSKTLWRPSSYFKKYSLKSKILLD